MIMVITGRTSGGGGTSQVTISLPTESCSDIAVLITLYVAQRENKEQEKNVPIIYNCIHYMEH